VIEMKNQADNIVKPIDKALAILNAIQQNPKVSAVEMASLLGISSRAVEKRLRSMRENDVIRRVGPDKGGHWEII
jgi:ATP-dependent DNA helicase RecG